MLNRPVHRKKSGIPIDVRYPGRYSCRCWVNTAANTNTETTKVEQRRAVYLLPRDLVEAVEKAAETETEKLGRKTYPAAIVRELLRKHLPGTNRPETKPRVRPALAK